MQKVRNWLKFGAVVGGACAALVGCAEYSDDLAYEEDLETRYEGAGVAAQFEGEAQSYTTSSGDSISASSSNARLQANAIGDTFTFTRTGLTAGTYRVSLRYATRNIYGNYEVRVGSTVVGSFSSYGSGTSDAWVTANLGNVTLGTSATIQFRVTGKNAASSDFDTKIDWLRIDPVDGGSGTGGTGGTTNTGGTGGTANSGGTGGTGGTTNTGGTTSTGGTSGSCTTPPAAPPLVGWAAVSGSGVSTTTGGGSAAPVTVRSLSELQAQASGTTPRVIYVQGSLAPGKISIGSNKTIVGLCGAEIRGAVTMSGSVNVIMRNLKVTGYGVGNCALDPDFDSSVGCSSGNDAIAVTNNAHHIWFDHLAVSNGTDGNLDINNGSDFVTVSWTKFSYSPRTDNVGNDSTGSAGHRFSNLIGGSDSRTSDRGKLNVTWHHNWWADNVVERQARVRYGKNHFFNNVWSSGTSNYCIRAGREGQIHADNNFFAGVRDAHEFNSSADQATAFISVAGNVYSGTSGVQETGGGGTRFAPSSFYSYSPTTAAQANTDVRAGAGPR